MRDLKYINEHRIAVDREPFKDLTDAEIQHHLALINEHAPEGNDPWMVKFNVLGYAGSEKPTILFQANDLDSCILFVKSYIRRGDWGGYDEIHVKNAEGVTETIFVREEE